MPVAHILLALLVTLIWGLNFVVIKVGLGDFPPLLFCALRFALAALPLLVLRGPMPAPFGRILLIGVLLGVVKFGLLFVGMAQGMPAGLSSLVLQSQVFFTILIAALWLGERPSPRGLFGLLLAAAGLSLWATGGEDWLDAAIILVIVAVNACISISQEDSAEKALEALRQMSAPLAKVLRDGKEIRLKDLWPSDEEIDAVVRAAVKPEQFRQVYIPMFDITHGEREKVDPLYAWRPTSTYIRRPPYWEGALAGERTLRGMRPLAVLPDNITTDHLSPSNAILADSAAGEYLAKMGLPEEDFNSYATHRGDHLTAQRATFANPKLFNEMVRNADGSVKQGSLARVEPEGKVMRMWEAIETYMERKQPLIIVAGADYGQGSSRDWAAKGVRLAGVEAIVAEGFERIHRTNLIGMGVLPLEFKPGTTRLTLGIDGSETFDVLGARRPRADLTLVIHRRDGERLEVPVTCRLDSDEEVAIYEAGGVLQRFAQDFLEGAKVA